jgi:hypothetical protein
MIKVLSHMTRTHRRDYDLADTDLADPNEADALDAGEWLELNSAGKLARAASAAAASASSNSYICLSVKGSTDMQVLGKAAVLKSRDAVVQTDMFDSADTFAVGEPVGLTMDTVDGASRMVFTRVLIEADVDYCYGTVDAFDSTNGLLTVHLHAPYRISAVLP